MCFNKLALINIIQSTRYINLKSIINNLARMVEIQRTQSLDSQLLLKDQSCRTMQTLWRTATHKYRMFMKDTAACENLDHVITLIMSNPLLLVGSIAVSVALAIPLFIFIVFAIITISFTFIGFIIVEGIVLTISTIILCCVLFCTISTVTVMLLCLALIYFGINQGLRIVRKSKIQKT